VKKEQVLEMSLEEIKTKLQDNIEALENLKFQKALQQLENPLKIRYVRREIAQLKTIIHEYELGLREEGKTKESKISGKS